MSNISKCNEQYPYIYLSGSYCCKHNKDKEGKNINFCSTSCKDNHQKKIRPGPIPVENIATSYCPTNSPNAYLSGKYCCAENKTRNNNDIKFCSKSCKGNKYKRCIDSRDEGICITNPEPNQVIHDDSPIVKHFAKMFLEQGYLPSVSIRLAELINGYVIEGEHQAQERLDMCGVPGKASCLTQYGNLNCAMYSINNLLQLKGQFKLNMFYFYNSFFIKLFRHNSKFGILSKPGRPDRLGRGDDDVGGPEENIIEWFIKDHKNGGFEPYVLKDVLDNTLKQQGLPVSSNICDLNNLINKELQNPHSSLECEQAYDYDPYSPPGTVQINNILEYEGCIIGTQAHWYCIRKLHYNGTYLIIDSLRCNTCNVFDSLFDAIKYGNYPFYTEQRKAIILIPKIPII